MSCGLNEFDCPEDPRYFVTANDVEIPTTIIRYPKPAPTCAGRKKEQAPERAKENTMDYNMEVDQRNHMKRRLDSAKSTKVEAMKDKFFLDKVNPKTKQEVIDALTNGNWFIDDNYYNEDGTQKWGYDAINTVRFADKRRDEAGYNTAKTALDKAFTEAKDKIIVLPLADGLASLQAFEAN